MRDQAMPVPADLVSVVVPVYNVQHYLAQCVDSILQQTHPALDVILVDDGSTDTSGAMCDAYTASDNRIRVIHQPNQGLSAARNAGISLAQGAWLLFVDSDDWIHHQIIELLLGLARESGADVAVGGFQRVRQGTGPSGTPPGSITVLTSEEALTALLGPRHTLLTVAWGKLFRRSLFQEVRFPVGRVHEDEFVSHRLLGSARGVVLIDRPLYYYRQHGGSIMGAGYQSAKAKDAIAAYADRLGFLQDVGRTDLLPEARAQLFRKYVRLFRGAAQRSEQEEVRGQMRNLASEMRAQGDRSLYAMFASAYAWSPRLVEPLYRVYERKNSLEGS